MRRPESAYPLVGDTGNGILDRHHQDAIELVLRGQSVDIKRLEGLAEALVIEEEEQLVPHDRPAEVHAELVAIERWLLKWNGEAGAADERRLEEAGGVQIGVANEVIEQRVEAIAAARRCHIDGRRRKNARTPRSRCS